MTGLGGHERERGAGQAAERGALAVQAGQLGADRSQFLD